MHYRPVVTSAFSLSDGSLVVFDQFGNRMIDLEGPVAEAAPKVRAAGFTGLIQPAAWHSSQEAAGQGADERG